MQKNRLNWPLVRRISTRGWKARVGRELRNGSHVGIAGKSGIILYRPANEIERRPEILDSGTWGNRTAPLVGLFLNGAKADECLAAPNLQINDPRFRDDSAQALAAIGDDHPVFVISGLHYAANAAAA